MAISLLESANIAFVYFTANVTYGNKKIREYSKSLEADMICPNKYNAKIIYKFDTGQNKRHNVVEIYFQKLKYYRRIATLYDKSFCIYRAVIYIASILIKIENKVRKNSLKTMCIKKCTNIISDIFFNTP